MSINRTGAYEIDMLHGPILGKILKFSLPLMLSSILQLLFNAADVVVVGRFAGNESLAAVGSTGSLINLITNMFIGLSIGANVIAARAAGARDDKSMSRTVHTSMLVSLISGVVLTIVGVAFADDFLGWMGTPDDVIDLAAVYLRIYFAGMTSMMLYNFGSAILRAIGDTKRPLYFLFIAGVVNVILNLIFVIVFKMGVAGVSLATIISQTISAVLVVICLMRSEGAIHFDPRRMHIDKSILKSIAVVGLPAGFQGVVFSISNVVIQSTVNTYGSVIMAGNSAAGNIEGFVYVAMNAFHQACVSFTSQNFAAGDRKRVWRILSASQVCVCAAGLVLGVAAWYFGRELLSIYSSSAAVIEAGKVRLTYLSLPYFLCGMMEVMVGSLRGVGYSITPMIVSMLGACVLRLVWIATICRLPQCAAIDYLYLSYPVSWIVTLMAHMVCFLLAMRTLKRRGRLV